MASLDKRNFDSVVYVFMQIKLMFDYKLQGRRKIIMFMKTRNSKREEEKKISNEYSDGCFLGESRDQACKLEARRLHAWFR